MRNTSVITEGHQIKYSVELIEMGARLQLLLEETSLSRERLTRLYKEVKGKSPSKGMLPYATDWFVGWTPNIHASLFMNIIVYFQRNVGVLGTEALIKSYKVYLEQMKIEGEAPVLSITRAWVLLRFFKAKMLRLTACKECGGEFVIHTDDLCKYYVCGICHKPARAGKQKIKSPVKESQVKKSQIKKSQIAYQPAM
ncbi:MAG: flagellar transcriptional regulator FlhC [Candidatus Nitrotoga sp.]